MKYKLYRPGTTRSPDCYMLEILDVLAKGGQFYEVSEGVFSRPGDSGAILWCWKAYSERTVCG